MRYGRLPRICPLRRDDIKKKLFYQRRSRFGDEKRAFIRKCEELFNDVAPPDLSLISRLHSVDWLYAYMRGFYRDPARPAAGTTRYLIM